LSDFKVNSSVGSINNKGIDSTISKRLLVISANSIQRLADRQRHLYYPPTKWLTLLSQRLFLPLIKTVLDG
jgi:hypothetical protein